MAKLDSSPNRRKRHREAAFEGIHSAEADGSMSHGALNASARSHTVVSQQQQDQTHSEEQHASPARLGRDNGHARTSSRRHGSELNTDCDSPSWKHGSRRHEQHHRFRRSDRARGSTAQRQGGQGAGEVMRPVPKQNGLSADGSNNPTRRQQAAHGPLPPPPDIAGQYAKGLDGRHGGNKRHAQQEPAQVAKPSSAAAPSGRPPRALISFGDELDEDEGSAGAKQDSAKQFSLAASTANRFQAERRLDSQQQLASQAQAMLNWPPRSTAPAGASQADSNATLGQLLFGVSSARGYQIVPAGMRPYMEDRSAVVASFTPQSAAGGPMRDGVLRSFAAIYDGHNGAHSATYCSTRLHALLAAHPALRGATGTGHSPTQEAAVRGALHEAFLQVDSEILTRCRAEDGRDGTTAVAMLRIGQVLHMAHCGDSRAVLAAPEALRLTQDHKPDLPAERERIEAAGGHVELVKCWRVVSPAHNGRPATGLAVSRGLGDLQFKEPVRLVEATPEVTSMQLQPTHQFIMMGSDGVFDVLDDEEVVTTVQAALQAHRTVTGSAKYSNEAAKTASDAVVKRALDLGSMDNVTALICLLPWSS